MNWPELHQTLLGLVTALDPAVDAPLRVESADIDVPLEVRTATGPNGPMIFARAPHSRWTSDFLTTVERARLVIEPVAREELQ